MGANGGSTQFRDEYARRVGAAVRSAREGKGWSREELAVSAKVSHGTVQSVEQGRTAPRPATLAKLAWALGLKPDDLIEVKRTFRKRAA